jgi:hypothetical protein
MEAELKLNEKENCLAVKSGGLELKTKTAVDIRSFSNSIVHQSTNNPRNFVNSRFRGEQDENSYSENKSLVQN